MASIISIPLMHLPAYLELPSAESGFNRWGIHHTDILQNVCYVRNVPACEHYEAKEGDNLSK